MLLVLLLLIFEASSVSVGSRSVLRSINNKHGEQSDFAVDLNSTNFDALLRETPATYAIVEFFAHWYIILIHLGLLFGFCFPILIEILTVTQSITLICEHLSYWLYMLDRELGIIVFRTAMKVC